MPVRTSTTLKFDPVGIIFLATDQSNSSTELVPAPSRSDLMKPSVPFCLTLDHPFDWFSKTSTLVLACRSLIMLWLVDGPDLKLTPVTVLNVAIAEPDEDDEDEPDADNRSDLIKPFVPLCLTFDQSP